MGITLNGLEWILRAIPGTGTGERAGHEGYVLAHGDIGFLVIQGQQARCGQDIGIGLLLQGV